MPENDPYRVLLIGVNSKTQSDVMEECGSGPDRLARLDHGFGSFRAALAYLGRKDAILPDLIRISNDTYMPRSDVVNGCKALAEQIILATKREEELPGIVIEDEDLYTLANVFSLSGVRVSFGSIEKALGFVSVETTR